MYVPHETTTPSSTHPRVSTRTSCLCLRGLLRSYLYSLHESSQTRSTHKTRPDLQLTPCCTLRHPVALPRVSFPAAFNSHSVRRTSDFLQVAVLKAPPTSTPINPRGFPWGRFQYSPRTSGELRGSSR